MFLLHDRVLRLLLVAWLVFIAGMGMSMVADVPLAEQFGAGSFGYGLLIAGWGAGSVLGALLGRYMRQGREGTWLVAAAAVMSAMGLGMWLSPWFSLIVALSFLFGLADGTTMVADQNLRQRRAPDHVRSRVASAFMGMMHALLALTYVAAAVIVPRIGPQRTYALGGVSAGLAVLVLLRMRRYLREDERAAGRARRLPRTTSRTSSISRPRRERHAADRRPPSRRRSPHLGDRRRGGLHGAELHDLGDHAVAVDAGARAAADVRASRGSCSRSPARWATGSTGGA